MGIIIGIKIVSIFIYKKIIVNIGKCLKVPFELTWTCYEDGDKPCGIPSELADVVIRILDFCESKNIDLESIIIEKMKYNESRPYKHGNKLN